MTILQPWIIFIALLFLSFDTNPQVLDDNTMKMIQEHGYKGERHSIITQDGYKLGMHRVLSNNITISKPPILMVHGIMLTSADWIILGPNKALAYFLSDNGYDVWLGNSRGNTYSMNHVVLNTESKDFWNFSFHEMGYYDLPAAIDYILFVTRQSRLFYAGHSQGTTQFFALLSTRPEYNAKIIQAHLLCPVVFSNHMPHPFALPLAEKFDGFVTSTGLFNFQTSIQFLIAFCGNPITVSICFPFLSAINGFNKNWENYIEQKTMPIILANMAMKTGIKQVHHYLQMVRSGKFAQFDNNGSPVDYPLEKVIAPLYIYHGSQDLLTSEVDIRTLIGKVPNVRNFKIFPNYMHVDVMYGKDSRESVYTDILKFMQ